MWLDHRPAYRGQRNERDLSPSQILFVAQGLVTRPQYVESGTLGSIQKVAIRQARKSSKCSRACLMILKVTPQAVRKVFVEQDVQSCN